MIVKYWKEALFTRGNIVIEGFANKSNTLIKIKKSDLKLVYQLKNTLWKCGSKVIEKGTIMMIFNSGHLTDLGYEIVI